MTFYVVLGYLTAGRPPELARSEATAEDARAAAHGWSVEPHLDHVEVREPGRLLGTYKGGELVELGDKVASLANATQPLPEPDKVASPAGSLEALEHRHADPRGGRYAAVQRKAIAGDVLRWCGHSHRTPARAERCALKLRKRLRGGWAVATSMEG